MNCLVTLVNGSAAHFLLCLLQRQAGDAKAKEPANYKPDTGSRPNSTTRLRQCLSLHNPPCDTCTDSFPCVEGKMLISLALVLQAHSGRPRGPCIAAAQSTSPTLRRSSDVAWPLWKRPQGGGRPVLRGAAVVEPETRRQRMEKNPNRNACVDAVPRLGY